MWSELAIAGGVVLVDDADLPLLAGREWYVATRAKGGRRYSVAMSARASNGDSLRLVRMHRHILGVTDAKVLVDHINRNPLDNRRANLRLASKSENTANGGGWGRSKYRGVAWDKRNSRWRASVTKDGRRKNLGRFDTEEAAARAYDAAARATHLNFAALNFPGVES